MKQNTKAANHLDELEINRLLRYLREKKIWEYYLIVRLGIATALRFSDLSSLCWTQLLGSKHLEIKEKKTNKTRTIPLCNDLQVDLAMIYEKLGRPEMNVPAIKLNIRSVNKRIKVLAHEAGIKKSNISTHTWRKSFGRIVWERQGCSEGSLVILSHLFNHSSTSITRIYLDITKEEVEDLYSVMEVSIY